MKDNGKIMKDKTKGQKAVRSCRARKKMNENQLAEFKKYLDDQLSNYDKQLERIRGQIEAGEYLGAMIYFSDVDPEVLNKGSFRV